MESRYDFDKHCELIGEFQAYPTQPEENNPLGFQYVTNMFRNNKTNMFDVVVHGM